MYESTNKHYANPSYSHEIGPVTPSFNSTASSQLAQSTTHSSSNQEMFSGYELSFTDILQIVIVLQVLYFLIQLTALLSVIQLNSNFKRFLDMYAADREDESAVTPLNNHIETGIENESKEVGAYKNTETEEQIAATKDQIPIVRRNLLIALGGLTFIWILIIALINFNT